MGCENNVKFKIGDRVRAISTSGGGGVQKGDVFIVTKSDDDYLSFFNHRVGQSDGWGASYFEHALTITPGNHYRTRSGKPTGRVTVGDTGFEAVVDGKVRIYDAAGGHVHGDADLDIVEAWVPRVGERVVVTYGNGWDGEGLVDHIADAKNNIIVELETGERAGFRGGFTSSQVEPLPVAAPQPAAALKIEAGKFYRTRDGRKVGPMIRQPDSFEWYDTKPKYDHGWYDNGLVCGRGEIKHDADLIAEWVDEPAAVAAPAVSEASNDNKPKFKVGDRVTVICNKTNGGDPIRQYALGGTYRITQIVKDLNGNDAVMLDNHHQYIKQGQFYLTTTAIVALIEDGQPKPADRPYVHLTEEAAAKEAKRLAGVHKGKQFGVFVLTTTAEEAKPVYRHEWQRLAADGRKDSAYGELAKVAGLRLPVARRVVLDWLAEAA